MMKTKFQKWLDEKYIDWCSFCGERKTLTEFAAFLGLKNATLNQWMNGHSIPRRELLFALWKKYGSEVYGVCGFEVPEYVRLIELADEFIPLEKKAELTRRAAEPCNQGDGGHTPRR